jgi:tetratricopeptide (TPR) repeat protein
MSKSIVRVLAVALVLVAGVFQADRLLAQQVPKMPTPSVSVALGDTFRAMKAALDAKRYSEVIAKAQEVLAAGGRKADDTFSAYNFMYQAYSAQGNEPEVRKALLGMVDAGFLSPAQQAPYVKALMSMSLQAKDYDGAATYGTRLTQGGFGDPSVFTAIGTSHYQKGDFAESARFFKSLVSEQVKRGQTPLETNLVMMQSAYEKLNNKEGATDTLEMLVVHYPKPAYWDALLFSVRGIATLQQRQRLFVYRLMSATNTLKLRQDYSKFAELAQGVPLPAETQQVYEAGLRAGVYPEAEKPTAVRRRDSAGRDAASHRANLAKLEAEAAATPTGGKDVLLGMALYSHGEPDKAIPILQRGLGKGGLQPDQQVEAALMLGIAQLRAKDKAGAQKTFGAIKTADPNWQRIVKFWALYAK